MFVLRKLKSKPQVSNKTISNHGYILITCKYIGSGWFRETRRCERRKNDRLETALKSPIGKADVKQCHRFNMSIIVHLAVLNQTCTLAVLPGPHPPSECACLGLSSQGKSGNLARNESRTFAKKTRMDDHGCDWDKPQAKDLFRSNSKTSST